MQSKIRISCKKGDISAKEALINSTNVMKGEAHGTQQPRHINLIGEGVSTAQRSNSLVQSINQRFPKQMLIIVCASDLLRWAVLRNLSIFMICLISCTPSALQLVLLSELISISLSETILIIKPIGC